MSEQTADLEKDYCVILRDLQGKFKNFNWIDAGKHSLEEVQAKIAEYNQKTQEQPEIFDKTCELVTDGLIREISAWAIKKLREKEQEKSDESGKEEALQKIKRALEFLEDAKDCLE